MGLGDVFVPGRLGMQEVDVVEDGFQEETQEPDSEDVRKTQSVKHVLDKRRQLDAVLQEHRLRRELRDYDFDLDD